MSNQKFIAAFLYVAPECSPDKQRALVPGDAIDMHVIGCSTYEQAEAAAKELVSLGCTAIELCAGFGNDGVARIQKAVGKDVSVGAVRFDYHPAFGFVSGDQKFAG